jgi:hypothetical protein
VSNPQKLRQSEWHDLEQSLGKRYADGQYCPPYDVEIYRLALAAAQSQPSTSAEAATLYEHFDLCELCNVKYAVALAALREELGNTGGSSPDMALFLPHASEEIRKASLSELGTALDYFAEPLEQAASPAEPRLPEHHAAPDSKSNANSGAGKQGQGLSGPSTQPNMEATSQSAVWETGAMGLHSEGRQEQVNSWSAVAAGTTPAAGDAPRKNILELLDTLEMVFRLCQNHISWEKIAKTVNKSPEDFLEEVVGGINWARSVFGGQPPSTSAVTDRTAGVERSNRV